MDPPRQGAETSAGVGADELGDPSRTLTFAALRRRVLRGSAWVFGGRVVTTILGLVINILLARMLTPAELGSYFTAYTLVIVGSIVAQLGLDRAVVRFVSGALGTDRPEDARSAIRTVFGAGAVGVAVVAVVVLAGGGWLARHVYHAPLLAAVIPVTVGWLAVAAVQSLFVETWRAFQRFDRATLFDQFLVDILAATVFGAFFALSAPLTLENVLLLSFAFSAAVTAVAGVLLISPIRRLPRGGRVPGREVFQFAWPVLITNTAIYLLSTGVDLLVLAAFQPQQQVALYGAAARLMLLVSTPYIILAGVLPPIITELYQQGRRAELERTLRAVSTLAGLPAFLALVVFIVFGEQVMGLLYGPFYRQGALILAILSAGRVVAVMCGASGLTLMMTGHQRALMNLTILTGIASVVGAILLAPRFGGVGVAVSTASVAAVQNILMYVLARRLTGIRTNAELSARPFLQFLFGRGLRARDRPES